MNLDELGQRIRKRRETRRLKQRDIANALQISAQAVSKWERGENAPDIAILPALCTLLDMSCDTLLGRADQKNDTFPATVFCTGLKGFAERSRDMAPRDVALWANGFFHLLTEAVLHYDGVPVKYVGDGFLAFFSGVEHAKRAVRAAQHSRFLVSSPELMLMLHSGDIYMGSMGHGEYARLDIIGETVNTAFLVLGSLGTCAPEGVGLSRAVVDLLDEDILVDGPQEVGLPLLGKPVEVFTPRRQTKNK